jgi:hypothetical protein
VATISTFLAVVTEPVLSRGGTLDSSLGADHLAIWAHAASI